MMIEQDKINFLKKYGDVNYTPEQQKELQDVKNTCSFLINNKNNNKGDNNET